MAWYGDPIMSRKTFWCTVDTQFCKIKFNFSNLKQLRLKGSNSKIIKKMLGTKVNGEQQRC